MKDISGLTKMRIRMQANRDVKNNRVIRVAPSEESLSLRVRDEEQADSIGSSMDSPFFAKVISAYPIYRDNHVFQKKWKIWIYNEDGSRKRMKCPLMECLEMISSNIALFSGKIARCSTDSKRELEELNMNHEQYIAKHEDHMVQMCLNQAQEVRANYAEVTRDYYEAVTALYGQKVEVLTKTKRLALAARAKCFRKIRYYAACACEKDPRLGPAYISDEDMDYKGDISLLGDYEEVLQEAIDQRDHYQEEYEEVETWK